MSFTRFGWQPTSKSMRLKCRAQVLAPLSGSAVHTEFVAAIPDHDPAPTRASLQD